MMHTLDFAPLHCSFTHNSTKYIWKRSIHQVRLARQIYCTANTQLNRSTTNRRSANYEPNSWNLYFVDSTGSSQVGESEKGATKKLLEEEVRCMLESKNLEPTELLDLVDVIERLGLGYRFRLSIKRALNNMISDGESTMKVKKSLHASALYFRLLRQNGFVVSTDIFESFRDNNGNFKENLAQDVKGMLSLYDASHLATEGESVLDEAKAFTSLHLRNLRGNIDKSIREQVNHALELPFHRRMQRLEARWNVEAYSERPGVDQRLLALAKLDYNDVQSVLQGELSEMTRWWRDVDLANKLSFARDRLMESFFWAVGMIFEPHFSKCRKGLTKVIKLITVLDDVYDVYGSVDELEQFTRAVDRWDINEVQSLPDYMKLCFLALYNTVNDLAYDTLKEKGEVVIPYLSKAWADLLKAFLQEARWSYKKHTPTLDEYLETAWVSSSGAVLMVHAYFLLTQNITKEAIECLENYNRLVRWPCRIFRLSNDLASAKAEIERGETTNAIPCYMQDTGHSEEAAREYVKKMIDDSWKKMNEDLMRCSYFESSFKDIAINLARIAHTQYQHGDAHSAPDKRARSRVLSVLFEPIPFVEAEDVELERDELVASY